MDRPSPAWAGVSVIHDSAEAEHMQLLDKLFVSYTGWQTFQWALGMAQQQNWSQSLGDISMSTTSTDHTVSHNS